jgi:hypothetical protein
VISVAADLELTVLPTLELLPSPELMWRSPELDGFVRTPAHLFELISCVGSAPGWEWLVVETDVLGVYAQACGSRAGVVAELSIGDDPRLVAQVGSASWPRRSVGAFGWHYLAHPDELHTPTQAFGIIADWIYDRRLESVLELRSVDGRGADWLD